ncbi:hypothetical protein PHYSODRAFT_313914 [Phytophthora sojae]|uniref:Uncharacterized protein n=1 Tax=Phytophthora sojae (strain P6497) TaxID=1094619 RepID=G4ZA73_PHYSP|nr:hypothetical protein PHYSODRAFT_313914 [Phytophthora sojae]EGZ21958.1 hypothetical protein PHYSODRAFT_313914 [Phytophthora sojae]|eukprot:XP_009524675.1 hypothetical protein PHYSODRAFT_313914 [Phytophthora sojae]
MESPSQYVDLSSWGFRLWWFILLSVHLVTFGYNASNGLFYYELESTYLYACLIYSGIGMPAEAHHTIANVNIAMAGMHGVCVLLMMTGSLRHRKLVFYPWQQETVWGREGVLGVNGSNFHAILAARELLETALQTVQAYRMSWLLPRMLFNRFYLILLVLNCWSSVAIYSRLFRWNEVRKRLACLMCDCILDLVSCIGVPLTVVLSYIDDFDPKIQGFPLLIWYDDVWSASVLNEFQMVVVVSWSDLASRTIFSFGLIMTTTSMKKLLRRASSAMVLALHIQASCQPEVPQCVLQVHPWALSEPACYLAVLDCYRLGISGSNDEVEAKWSEFDRSTVVTLVIRHCPALEVPDMIGDFHLTTGIKLYNSTINHWGEPAALTIANHPELIWSYLVRVDVTDGIIPVQGSDNIQFLYDLEFSHTSIHDLDSKWLMGTTIYLEYSQLTAVPPVLLRLEPFSLSLRGNAISELPPEVFEVTGMTYLNVGGLPIQELPRNVSRLSPQLVYMNMANTNISFFWQWVDPFVERRLGQPVVSLAMRETPYCSDLDEIIEMIRTFVNCTQVAEGFGNAYPITFEDSINALEAT